MLKAVGEIRWICGFGQTAGGNQPFPERRLRASRYSLPERRGNTRMAGFQIGAKSRSSRSSSPIKCQGTHDHEPFECRLNGKVEVPEDLLALRLQIGTLAAASRAVVHLSPPASLRLRPSPDPSVVRLTLFLALGTSSIIPAACGLTRSGFAGNAARHED